MLLKTWHHSIQLETEWRNSFEIASDNNQLRAQTAVWLKLSYMYQLSIFWANIILIWKMPLLRGFFPECTILRNDANLFVLRGLKTKDIPVYVHFRMNQKWHLTQMMAQRNENRHWQSISCYRIVSIMIGLDDLLVKADNWTITL